MATEGRASNASRLSETGRIEAFSDGVFAIATTLLIIEVHVPHGDNLGHELLRLWPSYLGYLTSFLTVGVMWINHHHLFTLIDRADRTFLLLNTLLLLCIAFVPFPTAVLAQYVRTGDARAAAVLYGATLTVTALVFNAVWRYASNDRRLLGPRAPQAEVDDITRAYTIGPFIYGASGVLAFASPKASAAAYLAIAVFFALPLAQWRAALRR
jgi:uncharacterized membrane protein